MFELIPFDHHMRSMANFDPFREFERSFFGSTPTVSAFRTDVTDTGEAYRLDAELPGFNKDDIKIDIENDCLTISAERKLDNENKSKEFVKRERFYGSYSRSFDVSGIDVDGIEASYNNGVLSLNMPKRSETVPPTRRLEIK